MLAAAPAGSETYLIATPALLAALPRALAAPPLELLGVTATLYLRPYLTASEHRAAMSAAYQRARAEAASWGEPSGVPAQPSSSLAFWNADRSELYLKSGAARSPAALPRTCCWRNMPAKSPSCWIDRRCPWHYASACCSRSQVLRTCLRDRLRP